MSASKTDLGLQRVQNLYVMHMELIRALSADLTDPRARKNIQTLMREYGSLLSKVDHRYMGGEDVLESLRKFPLEVKQMLRTSPAPRAVSRIKARVKARTTKVKTKSKAAAKRKTPMKRRKR